MIVWVLSSVKPDCLGGKCGQWQNPQVTEEYTAITRLQTMINVCVFGTFPKQ